jgi:uncharacterized protein (TIGR02453 family)
MISPSTIKFIQKLSRNNNKPWFDAHKEEYQTAKDDFESVVVPLMDKLCELEPAIRDQRAKDCIYRIFRDVRFSKDKTPYKEHFGAYFSRGGRKYPGAGYYLHIEPRGKSFIGGGLWMPEAPLLKAVRQEIDYNFDEFKSIVDAKDFKKQFGKLNGETLKTLPKGYDAENPAIEYLKMKSFTAGHGLEDKELTSKSFTANVIKVFKTLKPLVDFLNRPLD